MIRQNKNKLLQSLVERCRVSFSLGPIFLSGTPAQQGAFFILPLFQAMFHSHLISPTHYRRAHWFTPHSVNLTVLISLSLPLYLLTLILLSWLFISFLTSPPFCLSSSRQSLFFLHLFLNPVLLLWKSNSKVVQCVWIIAGSVVNHLFKKRLAIDASTFFKMKKKYY